jgi:c-di-GMP-binding flagellar brake protein YcgR
MMSYIEKRIDYRAEIDEQAKYKILSDSEKGLSFGYESAKTKNVSKGGLCLVMPHKLESGSVIRVEIPFEGDERVVKAFCEVQWCTQSDENSKYEVGLSFIALKEDDVSFITEYTNRKASKVM